ncbi:MAG: YciI family protein [Actinomycetota bacterium]
MPRYLISFDDGAMDHLGGDRSAADEAAHRFVRDAKEAGVWVTGGGLLRQQATIVGPDGTARLGEFPETKAVIGGFSIVDVPTLDDALYWARRISEACRCAQEVRLVMHDPEV